MKKLFLLLFTFSCLYAVGQVNERATAGFEFPFKIGDAQWKSYSSAKERVAALQIPEDKLKSLTTADLLTVCLDFPYAMDMLAYDYPEVGFNAVCKEFNGYRELLTRKDLTDALLKKMRSDSRRDSVHPEQRRSYPRRLLLQVLYPVLYDGD